MQVKKPRKRRPERISIATTQASSNHSFDTNVSALRLRGRLANPDPPRLSRRALDEIVTIAMAWPMSEKSVILNGAASKSYVYQDPVSERVVGMENEVRDALIVFQQAEAEAAATQGEGQAAARAQNGFTDKRGHKWRPNWHPRLAPCDLPRNGAECPSPSSQRGSSRHRLDWPRCHGGGAGRKGGGGSRRNDIARDVGGYRRGEGG